MKKTGPNVFSAEEGEVIRITVTSVNFVNNAAMDNDPSIRTPVADTDFVKVREFTMGTAKKVFIVSYGFFDPLPAGGKYTVTFESPKVGASDVNKPDDEIRTELGYVFKLAAPAIVTAARGEQ